MLISVCVWVTVHMFYFHSSMEKWRAWCSIGVVFNFAACLELIFRSDLLQMARLNFQSNETDSHTHSPYVFKFIMCVFTSTTFIFYAILILILFFIVWDNGRLKNRKWARCPVQKGVASILQMCFAMCGKNNILMTRKSKQHHGFCLKKHKWDILGSGWEIIIGQRILSANNAPNICENLLKGQREVWGLLY